MKNKKKILRKLATVLAISAVTASFVCTAVSAVTPNIVKSYNNVALDQNRSFEPLSWIKGYFETGNSSHRARAGTHFNTGSLNGQALTNLYYYTSSSLKPILLDYKGAVSGKGWVCSDWVTAPNGYTSVAKIRFIGQKYNDYGTLISIDQINVN